MTSTVQHQVSISSIAGRAALTLAVVLTSAVVITQSAHAQTYKVLYRFTGGADGATPYTALVRDAAGNLYGTTSYGGLPGCVVENGCGTVFKLNRRGKKKVLYRFTGGADGATPGGQALVRDAAGTLYGTATYGGLPGCLALGCGVAFKLDATGKYSVLYSFTGGADGGFPLSGLIRDAAGTFYGTASAGGVLGANCGGAGCGVVFKLDTSGKETVLYTFTGGADGQAPYTGSLVRDAAGILYGTTQLGGFNTCYAPYGCGVVFKLNTRGKEKVLHSFSWGVDGAFPHTGLIRDAAGNVYGTASYGGYPDCTLYCGVVFKLDAAGNYSVLYSFLGGADGEWPFGALVRDAAGNLYGTTAVGGDLTCSAPYGCGTVFKLDTTGKKTVLHIFTNVADGAAPFTGLIRDAAGNFYGTTAGGGDLTCTAPNGGSNGCGVVFKLTP